MQSVLKPYRNNLRLFLRQFYKYASVGGKVFYRIMAIDQDKKLTYSGIICVHTNAMRVLNIYPNPAQEKVKFILPERWQGVNNHQYALLRKDRLGRSFTFEREQTLDG